MMKITKIIFLALIGIMLFSTNAEALKPTSDSIEGLEAVQSGLKNVTEQVNAVTTKMEKIKQAIKDAYDAVLDKIEAVKEKVVGKICDKVAKTAEKINDKMDKVNKKVNQRVGNAKKKLGNKAASLKKKKEDEHFVMMEIATSSDLLSEDDMKNVDKVAEVINQLFLQYPSSDPIIQKKYRQKAKMFWLDTMSEMYVNTRELEKQLEDIEKMVEKIEDTQSQAKDLGGDGEGALNEAYISSYQAYTTMNALARLAETMAVLRAQYRAAKYITSIVDPAPFEGDDENHSEVILPLQQKEMYSYSINNNFKFAQMSLKSVDAKKSATNEAPAKAAMKAAAKTTAQAASKESTLSAKAAVQAAAVKANAANPAAAVAAKATDAVKAKAAAPAAAAAAVQAKAAAQSASKESAASAKAAVQATALKAKESASSANASVQSAVKEMAQKKSLEASAENAKFRQITSDKKAEAEMLQKAADKVKQEKSSSLKDTLKNAVNKLTGNSKSDAVKNAAQAVKDGKKEKINKKDIASMYELDKNGKPLRLKKAKAPEPEIKTQYAGTEEMFDSLAELDEVYGEVTKTLFVHNVEQNLPSFKDQFVEYRHMLDRHRQAVEKVKQSDACAVNYLASYYKTPEKVWYGGSTPADVTDYMNRKGVSGLVYKTYMLAKNLISEDVDMNDFSKIDLELQGDVSEDMGGTLDKTEDKANELYGESSVDEDDNSKGTTIGFSSASKQEEMTQNDRSREKLAFVVGAKVAKKMAKDQYSKSPQWGTPYRRFPIWEDQKDLYNQYLLGKGMNMRSYIESLLLIDETLNLAKYMLNNVKLLNDEEETKNTLSNMKSDISTLSNYVSSHREEIEERYDTLKPIKNVVAKRDAAIKAVQTVYMMKQKTLESKEKTLISQLDSLGKSIAGIQAKIDDQEHVSSEAESAEKQNESNAKDMGAKLKKKGLKTSGTMSLMLSEKVAAAATKAKAQNELKALNATLSVQKKAQKAKEDELAAVKSELAGLYEERDEEVLKVEEEYIEPIMKAKKLSSETASAYGSSPRQVAASMSLLERLINKTQNSTVSQVAAAVQSAMYDKENYLTDGDKGVLKSVSGLKVPFLTSKLLSLAQDILVNSSADLNGISIKKHVMDQIDDYYSNKLVRELRHHEVASFVPMLRINNLYTSAGHEDVVTNHKNLMYEISSLDNFSADAFKNLVGGRLSISASLAINLSGGEVLAKAIEIWRKAVIAGICAQNQCTIPDNVLYVAAIPNGRDFVAPRAASESFLPPMREIVYFDNYDYSRTPKKKRFSKMYVTRQAIIDNVEDLPDIWVDLLNRRSFVEVGYDMGSLDGDSKDYTRGGVFPCKYAGMYVDARGGEFKLYKSMPNINTNLLPHCQEIDIVKPKPLQCGLQGNKYLLGDRVYDYGLKCVDVENSADFGLEHREESELSQLLYYQSNKGKMRFTDEVVKAAKALERSEKIKEMTDKEFFTPEIAISQRAQMKRNQFGDFLSIVENEETIRQAKDEMSVSINDLRQSLIQTLREAGFSPREDLDLADEAQYKEVKDALEHIKNGNLKKIRSGLSSIDTKGNSALNERYENMNAIYFALVKDNEELLILDTASNGNSAEFAQKLISEKVNKVAAKKYKDEAEAEVQKDMNGGILPYCAIYGEGEPVLPNSDLKLLGQVHF